ncbi:hypothetical protein ACQCQ7_27115, partial [Ralstonia pseudosolanacearum]
MHRPPQPAANPLHDTAGRRSAGALAMLVAGLVLVGVNLRPAEPARSLFHHDHRENRRRMARPA